MGVGDPRSPCVFLLPSVCCTQRRRNYVSFLGLRAPFRGLGLTKSCLAGLVRAASQAAWAEQGGAQGVGDEGQEAAQVQGGLRVRLAAAERG